jgi:deoxyribonuclease-1
VTLQAEERGAEVKASSEKPTTSAIEPIIGNRSSKIYHLPNCPDYSNVSRRNRVSFKSEAEAVGYRRARNCND